MKPLRLAVIGWGRLGQACAAALHEAPDLMLAGVVRRANSLDAVAGGGALGAPMVSHARDLEAVDAALVCVPTGSVPGMVQELLQMRMPVVECASFEGRALLEHHERVAHLATRHRTGAVVAAGWNPGVLPQLRQLFELLIPKGQTRQFRHLAPGLHHTAVAEGVAGVQGALSSEVPDATGNVRRYVYVQLARDGDFERVRQQIEGDPLYADEATLVLPVPDLVALECEDRGVVIERLAAGVGGSHASLLLEARADESAFCARMMCDGARALVGLPHRAWRYSPFGLIPLFEAEVKAEPAPAAQRRRH